MVKTLEVPKEEGLCWFRQSLGQGFEVSAAVLASASLDCGRFFTFVSSGVSESEMRILRTPDVPSNVARLGLATFLDDMTERGASCVVIEDDVERSTDPNLGTPSAFLGDRVIHWQGLGPGLGLTVVEAIEEGAFGYPLNAFVVRRNTDDFGLVDGRSVPEDFPNQIASFLMAVIVSAFDATSFAVWTGDKGLSSLD